MDHKAEAERLLLPSGRPQTEHEEQIQATQALAHALLLTAEVELAAQEPRVEYVEVPADPGPQSWMIETYDDLGRYLKILQAEKTTAIVKSRRGSRYLVSGGRPPKQAWETYGEYRPPTYIDLGMVHIGRKIGSGEKLWGVEEFPIIILDGPDLQHG